MRPSFNPINQYLINELGIVVVEPNVRGSSGYGDAYLQLDFGMRRLDSLKDINMLLVTLPFFFFFLPCVIVSLFLCFVLMLD